MALLEFIFQSFWHFAGTLVLISLLVQWRPFASRGQGLTAKQFDKILDQIKEKKKEERGAFTDRIFLESVTEAGQGDGGKV